MRFVLMIHTENEEEKKVALDVAGRFDLTSATADEIVSMVVETPYLLSEIAMELQSDAKR